MTTAKNAPYYYCANEVLEIPSFKKAIDTYFSHQTAELAKFGRENYLEYYKFEHIRARNQIVSEEFLNDLKTDDNNCDVDTWKLFPGNSPEQAVVAGKRVKRMLPICDNDKARELFADLMTQVLTYLPNFANLLGENLTNIPVVPSKSPFHFSGKFVYPPGGCMGWHTNHDIPGHRLYITYAMPEGESFFRYCDPITKKIVTSPDTGLNVRIFETGYREPFWHCLKSETYRFSVGFKIEFPSLDLSRTDLSNSGSRPTEISPLA